MLTGFGKRDGGKWLADAGAAVLGEFEFLGNAGREVAQAMRDADLEPRVKFTGGREAAWGFRRFEHQYTLACPGQVSRADQTVVTRADNDGIVVRQNTGNPVVRLSR